MITAGSTSKGIDGQNLFNAAVEFVTNVASTEFTKNISDTAK